MWKRKALCSNGVPCLSRIRKRISPASASSSSSLRRAKLTRAALATDRSLAIDPSRRTKPWSRTRMASSAITLSVVVTGSASLTAVSASLRERFGWARFQPLGRLSGGYANDIFAAAADRERVVVRFVRPPVDPAGVEWEHRLLRRLAASTPLVVAPLAARDGSTFFLSKDGDAVVVLPFVEGKPAEPWFDAVAAATALGQLHRAAGGIDVEPRPGLTRLVDLRAGIESGGYFAAIGS